MTKRYQIGNQNPYIEERKDNIMTKRKSRKGQTPIYKTLHIKLHSTFATPSKHCIIQVLFYGMHYM